MGNKYTYGQLVRVSLTFKNAAGNESDPTAVYFEFTDPGGTETSYQYGVDAELVKDDTGQYHVDIDCDTAGTWVYRAYATGTGQTAVEGSFVVKESAFD